MWASPWMADGDRLGMVLDTLGRIVDGDQRCYRNRKRAQRGGMLRGPGVG